MAAGKKIVTAEEAKKRLGIESFRELSGAKVIELLNSMGSMDAETRKLIVAQFPTFRDFGNRAIDAIDNVQQKVQEADSAEAHAVHQAWVEVRAALTEELKRDDLGDEMRKYIVEKLVDTAERQQGLNKEGRAFRKMVLEWTSTAVGGVALAGAAVLFAVSKRG